MRMLRHAVGYLFTSLQAFWCWHCHLCNHPLQYCYHTFFYCIFRLLRCRRSQVVRDVPLSFSFTRLLSTSLARFVSVWCSFSQTVHCKMNVYSSPPPSVKMLKSKCVTTKMSLPHAHHSLHSHTCQWCIKSFLARYLCVCVNLSSPLLYITILFFSSPKNPRKKKIVCRCHYLSTPRSLIFSWSF